MAEVPSIVAFGSRNPSCKCVATQDRPRIRRIAGNFSPGRRHGGVCGQLSAVIRECTPSGLWHDDGVSAPILLLLSLLLPPVSGGETAAEPETDAALEMAIGLQEAFTRVADEVGPSIVGITALARAVPTEKTQKGSEAEETGGWTTEALDRYPGFEQLRSGSGFVVSAEGYIIGCRHTLLGPGGEGVAEIIDVEFEGDVHLRARVIGLEPTINLAILKVDGPVRPVPVVIGDSDSVRAGHWSIALGDPEGAERTFSTGNIAAIPSRDCYQERLSRTYLQSSVRIHPESYGGPLVDIRGRVIGVTTPRADGGADVSASVSGSVYAVPINLAMTIYEALRIKASRISPWLGISVLHMDPALRRRMGSSPRTGVYIENVFEPSPAFTAGVRSGDVLVSMNDERILSVQDFQRLLYLLGVGKKITVEVYRDGELFEREVVIEQRPAKANTR